MNKDEVFDRALPGSDCSADKDMHSSVQDDSGYLLTPGSVGGGCKVRSVLLPDMTRPNIAEALLMVSLPMAAAVLVLLKLSSTSTWD